MSKRRRNAALDPNENLREQDTCTNPGRLAELRWALAWWLAGGGVQPDWDAVPGAAAAFKSWAFDYSVFVDSRFSRP